MSEFYHHGIKGQKWGVRRFQNPDGTLTPEGKRKRASAKYRQLYDKAYSNDEVTKRGIQIYVDAYTKTAREYNDHKTVEFDKKHDYKKMGEEAYRAEYYKQFEEDLAKNMAKPYKQWVENTPQLREMHEYAKKYHLYEYDDFAKKNKKKYEHYKKYF